MQYIDAKTNAEYIFQLREHEKKITLIQWPMEWQQRPIPIQYAAVFTETLTFAQKSLSSIWAETPVTHFDA